MTIGLEGKLQIHLSNTTEPNPTVLKKTDVKQRGVYKYESAFLDIREKVTFL
jgi:hypothetical protein